MRGKTLNRFVKLKPLPCSNDRVKKKPPLRVVQSRFKAAAAAAKNNSGNSSSGSRNGSNNSSSLSSPGSRNGCLNTTLVGGSSTSVAGNKGPTKGRPVRYVLLLGYLVHWVQLSFIFFLLLLLFC